MPPWHLIDSIMMMAASSIQNITDAIEAKAAQEDYKTKSAQNANLTAAYGYASAYSAMMDA